MTKFPSTVKLPTDGKILRDAVHGDILIPNKYLAVIDTPEFQRLRRIKQLSVATMVFPSADHTRFSHSIGTFHIMQMLINHFESLVRELNINDAVVFSEEEKDLARLSALLHDIGHGPFSHAFEHLYDKKKHEDWTISIIESEESKVHQNIVSQFGQEYPEKVSRLISNQRDAKKGEPTKVIKNIDLFSIISSLISSQLDADRMDYLLRDGLHTGTNLGKIDLGRLISSFQLTVSKDNYVICIPEKHIQDVETYLLARYQMQKTVYYHDFKIQMEQIIRQIVDRAKKLYLDDKLEYHPKLIESLLRNDDLSISDYVSLDDSVFYYYFMEWENSNDQTLSALCKGILHRQKATKLPLINDQNPALEQFKLQFVELLDVSGYHTTIEALPSESFWIESTKSFSAYKPKEENIWIQKLNGSIDDITSISKIITTKEPTPIWKSDDKVVFINFNIINTLSINKLSSVIPSIHRLIDQYSPRNLIEIEKKYHFANKQVFDKIKSMLPDIKEEFSYECETLSAKKQIDIYYDTADGALESSNCTLRIRNTSSKYEITIKKPVNNQMDTGQSERFEFQETIENDSLDKNSDFIKSHLETILKPENLQRTLTIENDRQPITLKNKNVHFEMVFDSVTYSADGIEVKDYQLEIELKSDYAHRIKLKLLADYLEKNNKDLIVSKTSKYKRGLEKIRNAGDS